MENARHSSLRDSILTSITAFLYDEGFHKDEITKYGILETLNLISDYHEEGNPLYPEVLITNDIDFFKTIPNKEFVINETELSVFEFRNAVKLCAPLAVNSWIIFIEVKNARIRYGLVSAEMTETSPSLYNQTVGELKIEIEGTTVAYIRNIGQKTVELAGLKTRLIVSLTLDEPKALSSNEVHRLSDAIVFQCADRYKTHIKSFVEKLVDETLKAGHGNLIAVIDDDSIDDCKQNLRVSGGIYLPVPIDLQFLVTESETNRDSESSINLKTYSSMVKSMINHDGITIISTKARIISYHMLIDSYINEGDVLVGGARSKAFLSMRNCGHFKFCFYKSQDGNVKIWER